MIFGLQSGERWNTRYLDDYLLTLLPMYYSRARAWTQEKTGSTMQ